MCRLKIGPRAMSDSIAALLAHLHTCQEQGDTLAAREALEDYIDAEVDRRLSGLVGTTELARIWDVSVRRAQAHVAWLHERHGIGILLGGSWFLWCEQANENRPGKPGRRPNSKC
jgi:hypothetical protein